MLPQSFSENESLEFAFMGEIKAGFPSPAEDAREKRLQEAALHIQERFGKNAMLRGMNLDEGGTTIQRNGQVGGHRA